MLLLPRNLACLVKVAADDSARFSMNGVRIALQPDGTYRCETTDGNRLVRVTGMPDAATDYPVWPALAGAPNGATEAVVPKKDFEKAFKEATTKSLQPILQNVAVVMGEQVTTLGTAQSYFTEITGEGDAAVSVKLAEGAITRQPRNVTRRFPNTDQVFPNPYKRTITFTINPDYLAEMMKVMAEFTSADQPRVRVEVYDAATPIVFRAERADTGQEAVGLLMPIDDKLGADGEDPRKPLQAKLRSIEQLTEQALAGQADTAATLQQIHDLLTEEYRANMNRVLAEMDAEKAAQAA